METLKQFLNSVYRAVNKRRDSYLELAMALASEAHMTSVVALSESAVYRGGFGSVYDTLKAVELNEKALLRANLSVLNAASSWTAMKFRAVTVPLSNVKRHLA